MLCSTLTTSTTTSLFLLLFLFLAISTFFLQTNAINKHHNSLILPMTHTRSLPSLPLDTSDITEPLRGFKDGYLISLSLGTPPQLLQGYMDTGSDLTWFPCGAFSFECLACDDYKNIKLPPSFSPSQSSSSIRDTCTSPLCYNIHNSDNQYDPCAVAGCSMATILKGNCPRPCPSFSYTYGAGGVVLGSLTRDTLSVHGSDAIGTTTEVSNYCFGCVGSAFREPVGIVGFGRGGLSLPSQLGLLHKGFSHCFLGFKFASNPNMSSLLVIGDLAITSNEHLQFTPMLKCPMYPNYYYIGLEGITISNGTYLEMPMNLRSFDQEGNGGMLIDSGTTYTHLPKPVFSSLISALGSEVNYMRSTEVEERTGFELCYKVPVSSNHSHFNELLPSIKLHFVGNVELVLPSESCYYAMEAPRDGTVVKCLLLQVMEEDGSHGPAGVFGNFQQQNVEVVYDLEKERIGFHVVDCASSATSHGLHRD